MLTGQQEEKIESLYKEKSKLKPNKDSSDYFFQETPPQKGRGPETFCKDVLITS
jgi:hypothetical protein